MSHDDADTCTCGHVYDEHEDTTLAPCAIDDCACSAFDPE